MSQCYVGDPSAGQWPVDRCRKKSPRVTPHHLSDPSLLEATFFALTHSRPWLRVPSSVPKAFKAGSSAPA